MHITVVYEDGSWVVRQSTDDGLKPLVRIYDEDMVSPIVADVLLSYYMANAKDGEFEMTFKVEVDETNRAVSEVADVIEWNVRLLFDVEETDDEVTE